MNVSIEKNNSVSAVLTVSIEENDYKGKVEKRLKEIGKTHNIPGFRQGHVPAGELKRRFGKVVTSDVINDEVFDAVIKYIRENNLNVLGQPLPVDVKELDLKNEKDFTFQYELALAPELNVTLDKETKVPYYTIDVTSDMVAEQDTQFRQRFGVQAPGEEVEPNALVKGAIMELNADGTVKTDENAIQMINGIVAPQFFKDKNQAALFVGKKLNDKVVFNPWKTCDGNAAEISSMLGVSKDVAAEVKGDFEMAISEIIVLRPAEANQELFDNVLGKEKATTEEEYLAGVKAMIERDLVGSSDYLFRRDLDKVLLEKYGDMELPAEILKKWLVKSNDKVTEETVDDDYAKSEKALKLQLIKENIAKQLDIKIEEDDLMGYAKSMAAHQFAQYGMTNMDDETLADYAKRILSNKEYRPRIVEEVGDAKLYNAAKAVVALEEKTVSLSDFQKLAE